VRPPIGIVVGVKTEAALLRRAERRGLATVALSGADSARAAAAAQRLAEAGVGGLLSFGLCGGLDPALAPGDLLLPEAVVSAAGDLYPTDTDWRTALTSLLPEAVQRRARGGRLLAIDAIVTEPAHKRTLGQRHAALGVDLESLAVGKTAAAHGLPFLVVRACSDGLEDRLPPSLARATAADGGLRLGPLLGAAAGDTRALLRLASHSRRALATLRRAEACLFPEAASAEA